MDKQSHSDVTFGIYITVLYVYVLMYFNVVIFAWTAIPVFVFGKEFIDFLAYGKPSWEDIKAGLIPTRTIKLILPRFKQIFNKIFKRKK